MNIVPVGIKMAIGEWLGIYNAPVFACPVENCEFTGNYGREIWNHLVGKHNDKVHVERSSVVRETVVSDGGDRE